MSDSAHLTNQGSIGVSSDRLKQYANDDIQLMYDDVESSLDQLTRYGGPVVFKGAPGVGKSTSSFKVPYKLNKPSTYLAGRTGMYDAAEQKALEAGFDEDEIAKVPAPHRTCPTFLGDYGDQMRAEYKNLYSMGLSAAYLHNSKSIKPPCHTNGRNCPYMKQRIEDPDEYKVIIGHYKHAHDTKLIKGRLAFVDEFPGDDPIAQFSTSGEEGRTIKSALDQYFNYADFLPWESFEHLAGNIDSGCVEEPWRHAGNILSHPEGGDTDGLVVSEQELMGMNPRDRFHKKAPLIALALLSTDDLGNGWHSFCPGQSFTNDYPALTDQMGIARNTPGSENFKILMLEPTDLSAASQVIGLDGTARKVMWNTIFQQDFAIEEFISNEQMPTYVRDVQKMELWSSSNAARPYGGGNNIRSQSNAASVLFTKLMKDRPIAITAKKALSELKEDVPATFEHDTRSVDVTIAGSQSTEDAMTFGMVPSNNEAAGTEAICILGSPRPSDDVFKQWGALMGESVTRKPGTKGTDVVFEPEGVGQEIYHNFVTDVMEQTILRGRRGDGDETGSTVVVGAGCVPDWFSPSLGLNDGGDSPLGTEERRRLVRHLKDVGESTSSELDEMADFSSQARRNFIDALERREWIESEKQPGPKPTEYIWKGPPCE